MYRKIKYDNGFVPCYSDVGDELFRNGIFQFNISRLIEYLQSDAIKIPLEEVRTDSFPVEFSSITETNLESISFDQPVILAEIAPHQYNLIDGHHRMEKARRAGIDKLPCYKLNVSQHINFLTTREAYHAYVDYWNGKL